MAVELPHARHQRGEVALDLGQPDVDPRVRPGVSRGGEEVGQLGQPVPDGVEDRRLEPHGMAQCVEGVQQAGYGRLAPGGERPLQVLALELLGRGVPGAVVLRDLQQPPTDQRVEGPVDRLVRHRLVPARPDERGPYLLQVEGRRQHGGVLESGHQGDVEVPQVRGREPGTGPGPPLAIPVADRPWAEVAERV
jgi:hypothetical protein